jgi:predicted ester cyclase
MSAEDGIAVVRRNTEEVQGRGNFELFEELFAADFVDHTPQPGGFTPDRDGARNLYRALRAAFPDFHAEIHWQISDGDRVTTYKTYHGTHDGTFWGLAPSGRKIHFETVDVMRVRKRQDHRPLGCGESPVPRAATWVVPIGSAKRKSRWRSHMTNQSNGKVGLGALLTPDNGVLILIDHQPFQFAGLRSHDTQSVINNVVWLAKSAKIFGVPTLLTKYLTIYKGAPCGMCTTHKEQINEDVLAFING